MGRSIRRNRIPGIFLLALVTSILLAAVAALHEPVVAAGKEGPAAGKFLVASADLLDPNFSESVVLLLHYDADGALGVIVNRRTEMMLSELLPDIEELSERRDALYLGGPVAPRRFLMVFHADKKPDESREVVDGLFYSQSKELLARLANRATKKPRSVQFLVFAGHAGWGPGQLDRELERGGWHVVPADLDTIFDDNPANLWERLLPPEAHPEDRLRVHAEMGTFSISGS